MGSNVNGVGHFAAQNILAVPIALPKTDGTYAEVARLTKLQKAPPAFLSPIGLTPRCSSHSSFTMIAAIADACRGVNDGAKLDTKWPKPSAGVSVTLAPSGYHRPESTKKLSKIVVKSSDVSENVIAPHCTIVRPLWNQ